MRNRSAQHRQVGSIVIEITAVSPILTQLSPLISNGTGSQALRNFVRSETLPRAYARFREKVAGHRATARCHVAVHELSNHRTESNYRLIRTIVYRRSDCIEQRVKERCTASADRPYFLYANDFRYTVKMISDKAVQLDR